MNKEHATLLGLLGAMGLTTAGGYGLMQWIKHNVGGLPSVKGNNPKSVRQAKKDYGVDVGYIGNSPMIQDNAFYVPKEDVRAAMKEVNATSAELTRALRAARKHGLVVTGEGFNKPGIIEHELGHAVATHKGGPLERLSHTALAPVSAGLGVQLGMAHGINTGIKTRSALRGALAALSLSGPTALPLLYREHAANRYAREIMNDDMNKRVSYTPTLGSYAFGTAGAPAVFGGAVGLAHKLLT